MTWFNWIGIACIFISLCSIRFLYGTRQVAAGRLPGWNFVLLGLMSVSYYGAGVGMIASESWHFWPLIVALALTGFLLLRGALIHMRIAKERNPP